MKHLKVANLGQINNADISFGDLTLFIGPQATGKSILLQLIKLLLDSENILNILSKNGYQFKEDSANLIEIYFGEGMRNLWGDNTQVFLNEQNINLEDILRRKKAQILFRETTRKKEQLFFVPAQRVLTLENGWPRSFTNFDVGDPYVVRNFSENLRLLMQQGLGSKGSAIFPQKGRLKQELRDALDASIFHGAQVELNTTGMRKRIQINMKGNLLPFMAWSAGQREFMPLLLGLYWLMPLSKASKKSDINWVVIEEPEMGLHPRAILSVILMCLELLHRGYRLLISTHSPVLLEAIWAIRNLQNNNSDVKYLYQLFDLKPSPPITELFENILKNKKFSTYYFDQKEDGVEVRDISSLDPFDEDLSTADWGGLTSFSSRASEVVSQAIQDTL
ncbi:ATP-binding protein [Pseudanabaena sp. UWO311]|uniref:AAA family ATPase n=1 Tax=Pseudanabaena sp. UWO311 TaxID=2487337 RepID=UPI00115961AD|nr:AAA family ATPase [Pseudanabaena sp. UWO311]TYQ26625.1 ATP-binding protein [Pseudanabaena sp. UWO311]